MALSGVLDFVRHLPPAKPEATTQQFKLGAFALPRSVIDVEDGHSFFAVPTPST